MARKFAGSAMASSSLPSSKPNGSDDVPARDRAGHQADGGVVDREVGELDEAHADLLGERGDQLGLGEHALVDQHPAQRAAGALVLLVRGLQLGLGDQAALEQDVAELLHESPPPDVVGEVGRGSTMWNGCAPCRDAAGDQSEGEHRHRDRAGGRSPLRIGSRRAPSATPATTAACAASAGYDQSVSTQACTPSRRLATTAAPTSRESAARAASPVGPRRRRSRADEHGGEQHAPAAGPAAGRPRPVPAAARSAPAARPPSRSGPARRPPRRRGRSRPRPPGWCRTRSATPARTRSGRRRSGPASPPRPPAPRYRRTGRRWS